MDLPENVPPQPNPKVRVHSLSPPGRSQAPIGQSIDGSPIARDVSLDDQVLNHKIAIAFDPGPRRKIVQLQSHCFINRQRGRLLSLGRTGPFPKESAAGLGAASKRLGEIFGRCVAIYIPGFDKRKNVAATSLYEINLVSSDELNGMETYNAKILVPTQELFIADFGRRKPVSFDVTFSKLNDWLPESLAIQFEDGVPFFVKFGDWRMEHELLFPHRVRVFEKPNMEGAPFYDLALVEVSMPTEETVRSRCNLDYYGLPGFESGKRNGKARWIGIGVIIVGLVVGYRFWKHRD